MNYTTGDADVSQYMFQVTPSGILHHVVSQVTEVSFHSLPFQGVLIHQNAIYAWKDAMPGALRLLA